MQDLVALFLEVIVLAVILFVVGPFAPHSLAVTSKAIMALIVYMTIVGSLIMAVAFNGSCDIYDCNVGGSLIHSYVQQEDEPYSFPLAACPWQSSQECQPPCRLLDTAQRRQSS